MLNGIPFFFRHQVTSGLKLCWRSEQIIAALKPCAIQKSDALIGVGLLRNQGRA